MIAGLTHLTFIPLFFFLDIPVLAVINIFSVAVYAYCIYGLGDSTLMTHDDRMIGWLVYAELLIHSSVATYFLGLESGFHYYIYILAILPFFTSRYSLSIHLTRLAGIIIVALFLNNYFRDHHPALQIDRNYIFILGNLNLTIFLLLSSFFIYIYAQRSDEYHNDLLQHSIIDPLTGLYNRRYMNEYMDRLLQRDSKDTTLSLLVIDIDDFKQINDTYGHDFGDRVIQEVSQILKACVGTHTVVSRWGGEEFIILFTSYNKEETLESIAKKIIKKVAAHHMTIQDNEISVTLTCGGVTREAQESFSQLFIKADEALYHGKRSGKNCYVSADT